MAGKLVIFSSPSGAGKTTLVKHLLSLSWGLRFSVSATSRPKRPHEEEGRDYYFLDQATFRKKVENKDFLEWEEVYEGLLYGTLRSEVERDLQEGKHVIFDVDVNGAIRIKRIFGDQALAVFVQPPSLDALETRLRGRRTESEETLKQRLERAQMEMDQAGKFDVVIVNDNLEDAKRKAEKAVGSFLGFNPNYSLE